MQINSNGHIPGVPRREEGKRTRAKRGNGKNYPIHAQRFSLLPVPLVRHVGSLQHCRLSL